MHVTPGELRIVQQDRIVIRFALLGSMAFVLVDVPATGSQGTSMEQPCVKPHWGFVSSGEFQFECGDRLQTLGPGTAFHVPAGGEAHRFTASGPGKIAGFEPIDPGLDVTNSALAARGLTVIQAKEPDAATMIPAAVKPFDEPRKIDVRAWPMSQLLMVRARFGPGSGYTADWCDAPHWGLVTSGRIAIEWEDDIEILGPGDVYHCPAGPPGHRLEAADPASVIDLTPIVGLRRGRVAPWRVSAAQDDSVGQDPIAVAGLS